MSPPTTPTSSRLCAAQSARSLRPDLIGNGRIDVRQSHQFASQARYAALLARAGICCRSAWPRLSDRRRFDPPAAGVLAALSRNSALQARLQGRTHRQTPEWASTHPMSENRMQRELAEARASGRIGTEVRNRDAFLRQLDGVYVDDDPVQRSSTARASPTPTFGSSSTYPRDS